MFLLKTIAIPLGRDIFQKHALKEKVRYSAIRESHQNDKNDNKNEQRCFTNREN
jgi:hypothetical protein